MAQFKNTHESHAHSMEILNLLYGYDSFLDSLQVIADVGCGSGADLNWWATLYTRDDPPEPRNYFCFGVDKSIAQVNPETAKLKNVKLIEEDMSKFRLFRKADLLWCHDSFQYAINPIETLRNFNKNMNVNGMLVMSIPQNVAYVHNRLSFRTENYCYYNYNIINLIYMLAVSGFDCKDAYFYKHPQNNWIQLAVYKASDEYLDPASTSLYDLAEQNLLHQTMVDSLNLYGHIRQEDVVLPWLDKDFYILKN